MSDKSKFDKWYEETWSSKSEDTDESNKAFCAWEACKNEILNILKYRTQHKFYDGGGTGSIIHPIAIEDIKNL